VKLIPLKDIKITRIQSDGTFKPSPIEQSAYYRALEDSSELIYKLYLDKLSAYHYKRPITSDDEMSYDEFEILFQDIKEKGFHAQDPFITIYNNEAGDGQHRLAIMYFIAPDSAVEVDERGRVLRWVS
jgi:hypothetical protein